MDIFTCPWEHPQFFIFSNNVSILLYYSHGIAAISTLIFSLFLLYKKRDLITIIFFVMNTLFLFWVFFDLIQWSSNKNNIIYFFWIITILVELLIYVFAFYLTIVFLKKKDLLFFDKMILLVVLLPVIFLLPTKYILNQINILSCVPSESKFIIYYSYIFEIILILFIVVNYVKNFKIEKNKNNKKKITLFIIGIIIFLLAFSWGNIIGSFTENWTISQFGLFGMPIFIGFLAYLIVRFQAFDIKLLGAQVLVMALLIFIGSMFAFVNNATQRILVGVTLILSCIAGWALVRSVKLEVQRKEELQKMTDELALSNKKLKIANEKLKRLDQVKSDFFSRASHDLRGPITSINGYLSMIEDGTYGEVNKEQKSVLQKVMNITKNILVLVGDFLTAAKLEAGGIQYNFSQINIEEICEQVVEIFYPKSKEKGIYLNFEKSKKKLPKIFVDKDRIRESISNLVDNAIKYTEKGGVDIKIELDKSSDYNPANFNDQDREILPLISGSVIRIIISDTGMGIPQDGIKLLFSRFFRGKGQASIKTSGTGLGLYICRGLIEDNGGRIWAESEGEGKGSRFIIEFPAETPKEIVKIIEESKLE